MATLTKNTAGSLKKMWPPVKKKAIEAHESFAAFLGQSGHTTNGETKSAPALKANTNKKRKATDENLYDAANDDKEEPEPVSGGKKPGNSKVDTKKKKAVAAKGKGGSRKKAKEMPAEPASENETGTDVRSKSDKNSNADDESLGECAYV